MTVETPLLQKAFDLIKEAGITHDKPSRLMGASAVAAKGLQHGFVRQQIIDEIVAGAPFERPELSHMVPGDEPVSTDEFAAKWNHC